MCPCFIAYLTDISNKKRCYTCIAGDCSSTMECLGDEDRCVTSVSTGEFTKCIFNPISPWHPRFDRFRLGEHCEQMRFSFFCWVHAEKFMLSVLSVHYVSSHVFLI